MINDDIVLLYGSTKLPAYDCKVIFKDKNGTKYLMQYRWRCTFRDAYQVCLLIWPWSHTKLPKIQQIIQHYADKKVMNDNVVDLLEYKKLMSLE